MIDVPSDLDSVVKRWFPAGVDLIAVAREADPVGVFVTGTSGAGVSAVETELDSIPDSSLQRAPDAESAAVVLFVLDASAPLGRGALAALAPVLESTATGVVVNKIDVHRNWRDVQQSVSKSVAEHVPRAVDVTFWPTSAKLAERARAAIDPRMRVTLYEESGILDVHGFAASAMARHRDVLREHKYNAAVRQAAAGARRQIVDKARAVTSSSTTAGLRAERARLSEVRDRTRTERAALLRSSMQLARSETVHDVGDTMRRFASWARESIDAAGRVELRHLHENLGVRLAQAVSDADLRVEERIRGVCAALELPAPGSAPPTPTVEQSPPGVRRRGIEDKTMIVVGASAGVGLGRIIVSPLTMVPALDIATLPVSLLLGALCAWWLVRSRQLVAERAHLRSWASDAVASARSSLEQTTLARIVSAETALSSALHETSRSAASATEVELARVEEQLRAAAERRAVVLAACDRDLASLDRGVEKFGGPIGVRTLVAKSPSAAEPPGRPARL